MTAFEPLMGIPASMPDRLLPDKGYDADRTRQSLEADKIEPVIPPRANHKNRIHCDFKAYKYRNPLSKHF